MEAEHTFEAHAETVHSVRNFVRERIEGVNVDTFVAVLLANELASNAVVHARTSYAVKLMTEAEWLRIEVVNDEPELLLRSTHPDASDSRGGFGLRLMNTFADDWGAYSERDRKVVWFELGLH